MTEETRKCYQCERPETEVGLLSVLLPPLIIGTPQDLCHECLKQTIQGSKKGKAVE